MESPQKKTMKASEKRTGTRRPMALTIYFIVAPRVVENKEKAKTGIGHRIKKTIIDLIFFMLWTREGTRCYHTTDCTLDNE